MEEAKAVRTEEEAQAPESKGIAWQSHHWVTTGKPL